jgi:serine/threonine-protein kinase RsbW
VDERLEDPMDVAPLRPCEVEIRLLAAPDRVPAVRGLAADLARRADLDLDTVEDVRLAVEEACAAVVANADRHGLLVCRLLITPAAVEVAATVALPDGRRPAVGPFSLRVLRTLADSVDFWTTHDNRHDRRFHVQFTKNVT